MQDTTFQTYDIPGAVTPESRPLIVAVGTKVPVRADIENIGPLTIFLGKAAQDVVNVGVPGSTTYQLLPNQNRAFVLAPGEKLYAICAAVGGIVSVSPSEALPLV